MGCIKVGGSPDGIDYFIAIFPGQFGAHLVDFTDSMAPGFATGYQNAMQIIGANMIQTGKVSLICY